MKSWAQWLIGLLALLALALAALWWRERTTPPVPEPPEVQPVQSSASAAASSPAAVAIEYPISPADSASEPSFVMPAPEDSDVAVRAYLIDLAGREGVLRFLQIDDFVRRFVATVDNLDRAHASSRLWPVNPTPGRFVTAGADDAQTIAADNALRYAPFVQFVESVDMKKAAALYRWLYPFFQRRYVDLGYPDGYFNDRLVRVIDHLLRTPVPKAPVAVTLLEIKGPVPSERPWVHYRFADPALEEASAGQKMLLRMGPVNQRRLQARLAEFRRALLGVSTPR